MLKFTNLRTFRIEMRKNLKEYLLGKLRGNLGFLLVLCTSLIEVFLNIGRMIYGDSYQYLNFALFFLGRGGYISPYIVMRPMVPFLASALTLVFGNIYLSFGLVSGFFWVSGATIAYKIGQLILDEKDLATAVGLSFTTAPVLLLTGAAVLTDSAGFFFMGLAIYLTLKREQTKAVSHKTYFLDALICSIGLLFRESVVFALLFMFSRRLLKKKRFIESLFAMLCVGVVWLVYLQLLGFDANVFLQKYFLSQSMAKPESWGFITYVATFATAFAISVPVPEPYFVSASFLIWTVPTLIYAAFTLLGFIFSTRKKDLWAVMLFLFPSSVIWPEMSSRFSFFMWPAVIPAMISGMNIAFSRLRPVTKGIPRGFKFFIFLYIIVFAIVNTWSTLDSHGSLTIAPR